MPAGTARSSMRCPQLPRVSPEFSTSTFKSANEQDWLLKTLGCRQVRLIYIPEIDGGDQPLSRGTNSAKRMRNSPGGLLQFVLELLGGGSSSNQLGSVRKSIKLNECSFVM